MSSDEPHLRPARTDVESSNSFRRIPIPTVAVIGPYRFFFFSNEGDEPAHIHIERDQYLAKFWILPASLAHSTGFSATELRKIERLVSKNQARFTEAWNAYFID